MEAATTPIQKFTYDVTHKTKYTYSEAVPVCHNVVRLVPLSADHQTCVRHRCLILPTPADRVHRQDYFGNRVDHFSIYRAHRSLSVTAFSRVVVTGKEPLDLLASKPWEEIRDQLGSQRDEPHLRGYELSFPSPLLPPFPEIEAYAAQSFLPERPILDAAKDLTHRIYTDFAYDPKATTVSTPLLVAFKQRRGVCQDFAHVEIACLRSMGLAARYVSGYLRTTPPEGTVRLVGADASHAWLSVFAGPEGWVDFDPTNDVIPSGDHITLAYGRDYDDVCPVKGTFVGGGQHGVSVSVDVLPVVETS